MPNPFYIKTEKHRFTKNETINTDHGTGTGAVGAADRRSKTLKKIRMITVAVAELEWKLGFF